MLTNVHCCLQVSLAPLCKTLLNKRGYEDDDDDDEDDDDDNDDDVEAERTRGCFFISCSDGVNNKRHRAQR